MSIYDGVERSGMPEEARDLQLLLPHLWSNAPMRLAYLPLGGDVRPIRKRGQRGLRPEYAHEQARSPSAVHAHKEVRIARADRPIIFSAV